ncbi:MAG: flagellar FlbD family protein [Firmicutes bacterium]|nr:flagellar FlbD family protein [Bacillota bacterium]
MILVTRLDGKQFVVNAELIETIESTPDTVVSLTTHQKYVVQESIQEIVNRVVRYHQELNLGLKPDANISDNH